MWEVEVGNGNGAEMEIRKQKQKPVSEILSYYFLSPT